MGDAIIDSVCKDLRPLVRKARKQGWSMHWTGSGHLAMVNPRGHMVTTSVRNLSGVRKLHNVRAALVRAGLRL
jgi:hypothetical protein